MDVAYCEESTIREAWAAVTGLPGPVDQFEATSLAMALRREFGELDIQTVGRVVPAQAAALARPPDDAAVPPVWFHEARVEQHAWMARWGHRVSALHRQVRDGELYRTYDDTMCPTIVRWLRAIGVGYATAELHPPAATVVFGYRNVLKLGSSDPDVSEFFRFNFSVDAHGSAGGLDAFVVAARIVHPEDRARTSITLHATGDGAGGIIVTVDAIAERDLPSGATFGNSELLLAEIGAARLLAKRGFFSFATDTTLLRLKAHATAIQP